MPCCYNSYKYVPMIISNNDNRGIKDLAVKHQCSEVVTVTDIIKMTPFNSVSYINKFMADWITKLWLPGSTSYWQTGYEQTQMNKTCLRSNSSILIQKIRLLRFWNWRLMRETERIRRPWDRHDLPLTLW